MQNTGAMPWPLAAGRHLHGRPSTVAVVYRKEQNQVLVKKMAAINALPPEFGPGNLLVGPTLLEFGTEKQKQRHIPKIVSGEVRWCQGYSEPGAGSDLASLQCKAVLEGDRFLVNGQKFWTSGAHQADWMFALVRTDFAAPKHDGISFVLLDMHQPGVTVRPIPLISGSSPFCETFLMMLLRGGTIWWVN